MLLFDLDGTLLDSNGIWKEVDKTFLARRGMPYTREYYAGVAHTIFPKAAEFTRAYCHLNESCEAIMAEWMELAQGLYDTVPVKPGVRAYLEQCRAEGKRMAVVTSSVPEHCHGALQHLGLEQYFAYITFAHDLGISKESPEVWLAAAAQGGVPPECCTAFDDSIAACRGARAAHMRTVGVRDALCEAEQPDLQALCDIYIQSFEELLLP